MKKLISVLLTLAMMLALCSLAGCGDKEKSSDKEKGEKKEETPSVCYPENALLAKQTFFDNKGNKLGSYEYTYDANGNVLRARAYGENGDEVWENCMDFSYDDKGNLIGTRRFDEDGKVSSGTTYEYSYDADGKVTSKRTLDPDGTVANEAFYTYDADGKLKSVRYREDTEILYDANGNEIEYRVKVPDEADGIGGWRTVVKCVYDADGNMLAYGEDNQYTYDEYGNCTSYRSYDYDDDDDLVLDGEIQYSYTYDKNGNATSCRTSKSGKFADDANRDNNWDATYDKNGNILTVTGMVNGYDVSGMSGDRAGKVECTYLDQSGSKKLSVEDTIEHYHSLLESSC